MNESSVITMTTLSTVVGIVEGDPPSLVTVKYAVNSRGIGRHITQRMAFADRCLFDRFAAEVHKGEEVRLTTFTDWSAANFRTKLVDFEKLTTDAPAPSPAKELVAQAA